MSVLEYILESEDASFALAGALADALLYPCRLGLTGPIGAGKTTLLRSLLQKLGVSERIKSPTYALVETYSTRTKTIHHFDLYRIMSEDELVMLGFSEYAENADLLCIEWPELSTMVMEVLDIHGSLSFQGLGRSIVFEAHTPTGEQVLERLSTCLGNDDLRL